jgi:hypothetical protein
MMRNARSVFGVLLIAGMAFSIPAYAGTIIFSNLVQPGDQYGPDPSGIGHTPAFPPGVSGFVYGATRFIPSATARLTEIAVPLAYGGIGPNQAEVFLMSDTAGLPGTIIESFAIQNLPFGDSAGLTMIQSVSRPLLNSGQQYWVARLPVPTRSRCGY